MARLAGPVVLCQSVERDSHGRVTNVVDPFRIVSVPSLPGRLKRACLFARVQGDPLERYSVRADILAPSQTIISSADGIGTIDASGNVDVVIEFEDIPISTPSVEFRFKIDGLLVSSTTLSIERIS